MDFLLSSRLAKWLLDSFRNCVLIHRFYTKKEQVCLG
jgi:hypothetical protein